MSRVGRKQPQDQDLEDPGESLLLSHSRPDVAHSVTTAFGWFCSVDPTSPGVQAIDGMLGRVGQSNP